MNTTAKALRNLRILNAGSAALGLLYAVAYVSMAIDGVLTPAEIHAGVVLTGTGMLLVRAYNQRHAQLVKRLGRAIQGGRL
jgi:hypothetical protein